ncbi:MAG TPA: AMP-dependent synthetase [Spirochaetaceae bacterium]|jgi:long-chain acyl-CoA synthetase|nr:AMP-dependent synthetase [Spirochaetaceae bacterium]
MLYDYDSHTLADIAVRGALLFHSLPALGMADAKAISYLELERLSRQGAARLQALGVAKGDRVLLLSENRPEWGIASFSIARAGAVAVPVLTDFSEAQVLAIAAHAGAKLAIVSAKQAKKLSSAALRLIAIEELSTPTADAAIAERSEAFASPPISPGDLAAIVYTSGTTGTPKGVMLSHRNYLADALACRSVIVLSPRDTLLSILPLAHAYEYTIGFLIPMMSGASIRYLDRPPSASALLPALATVRPTIVLSVPLVIEKVYKSGVKPGLEGIALYRFPLLRPLLERLAGAKLKRSFGGRLRFFGIGGAPLDPEVERFLIAARFPYAIGYGLTETAPIIAASAVGKTKLRAAGPALEGADIKLAEQKPAAEDPSLMVGELRVRGPMVFSGYYKDDERTAEAFDEEGYFRTGDLGFKDDKGRFHLRGRSKNMILGPAGENIYPEELEALLNRSPYVAESLVYADVEGLGALVQLKPELLEELGACAQDGLAGAERLASRWGKAAGEALQGAVSQLGQAGKAAEQAAQRILELVRKEANAKLASFSRISRVAAQDGPFEKTPTQKIKRYLYPKTSRP